MLCSPPLHSCRAANNLFSLRFCLPDNDNQSPSIGPLDAQEQKVLIEYRLERSQSQRRIGSNSLRELTKPSHRQDRVKLKKTYHHNQKKLRQITKVNHFKGDQTSKPIIHHLLTLNPIPFNLSLPLCLFLSFPHQPGQCLIT